jgi:hypothetical protein
MNLPMAALRSLTERNRGGRRRLLQELEELLVPLFRIACVGGDAPGGDLQRGEQGGGAVAL